MVRTMADVDVSVPAALDMRNMRINASGGNVLGKLSLKYSYNDLSYRNV